MIWRGRAGSREGRASDQGSTASEWQSRGQNPRLRLPTQGSLQPSSGRRISPDLPSNFRAAHLSDQE